MLKKILPQPTFPLTISSLPGISTPADYHATPGSTFSFENASCKHCYDFGVECGYCGNGVDYETGSLDSLFNEAKEADLMPGYTVESWNGYVPRWRR